MIARPRISIAGKLSLLTGAVIALCLCVLVVAAYQTLTRSAIASTQERLARSTRQLADLAATGIRQNTLRYLTVARDTALQRALDVFDGNVTPHASEVVEGARQALARLQLPNDSGMVAELWHASGRRVAYVGDGQSISAAAPADLSSLGARRMLRETLTSSRIKDSTRLGRLYVSGGRVYFWVVHPIVDARGFRGFIAHERQIASNAQADLGARALSGEGVTTYYGNADGTVWSTVGGRPVTLTRATTSGRRRSAPTSDRQVLVATAPVPGTPLQIMMQSELDYVLAPARLTLQHLIIVGTLVIAAGMGAALLIGRRVAAPIVAITDAATAIARGEYDTRVSATDDTEVATLAESFNHMANELSTAEETRREIAHMGRVAVVAELAASISHEVRQPLTAIRANAEAGLAILRRRPADLVDATESFHGIVTDCDRAEEIIDQVRSLLRKDTGARTTVDLNEICRQTVHLLQQDAARRRTDLDLALAPSSLTVVGDPVQLQQVVLNLTLNALDAASSSTGQRKVRISTAARQDAAEIAICDDGPGLPSDVQERLFEPFFTTKTQGLGMGLAIVRSIVERHRGRVRAENVGKEGGAVFKVTLPVSGVDAPRSGPNLHASSYAR